MGKIIYGTHIEVPAPFDAKSCDAMDTRLVVETKEDLTTNAMATFNGTGRYCFVYEGIQVYVRNEKSTYMYVGPNDGKNGILLSEVQKDSNWRKLSDPTSDPGELGNTISKIQSDVIKNKVTNSDKTITVTPPENDGNTDIKVAIANADTNILKIGTDGLDTEIALKRVESVTDNTLASQYQLVGKNNKVLGTTIDIPKDRLLKDAKLGYANASVNESTGEITIGSAGASEIEGQPQYLVLSMSIDTGAYKGVVVNLSQFLTEKEFKDGLVLEGNVVKGNVKTDDKFLGVDENGFFTKGIEDAINTAAAKVSNKIAEKSTGRVTVTAKVEADGHTTYTIDENDIAQATVLNGEIDRAKAAELKTNQGVGLNDDGSHKTTTGNYTAAATTIAGEISALDAQVHTNATNIANYKDAIDNYTIGGAKISTNPVLTGENGVTVSGLAISLNLATDGTLEIGSNGLKLADTIDCGTYV